MKTEAEIPQYQELPTCFPHHLGGKFLFIFGSMLFFLLTPGLLATELIGRFYFRFTPNEPVPHNAVGIAFMVCFCVAFLVGGLAGKYLGVIFLARFVSKADVAPFLAYGIPRRLSRSDRRLLHRFYKTDDVPVPHQNEPDEPRGELTGREVCGLIFVMVLFSGFLTCNIPNAYAYPKHNWGDWLVFVIMFCFTLASWIASLALGLLAARISRTDKGKSP